MKKLKISKRFPAKKCQFKKAQVGIEYMIIVGFVTFAIMSVLVLAMSYSGQVKDKIKLNQVESFAEQLLNSAESVFFAGEPSKTTINLYLPDGVKEINITSDYLIISVNLSSGENRRVFESKVPIRGTISTGEGIKKLTLTATDNDLFISQ